MFEELRRKFSRREEEKEEIEFKPFEESAKVAATAPTASDEVLAATMNSAKNDSVELKVIRPESYQEVGAVADNLLSGCTVVLNLEALDRVSVVRMLDFLNGVTYCTDGEIKKVAATTFIITPHENVDVSDF